MAELLTAAGAAEGGVIGQTLHGLGGVGKTELALRFAHAHRDRFSLVWWINAATPEQIVLGLAELTRRLHPVARLADAQVWAVGWLQAHPGWLLVLDNVEDAAHITGLLGQVRGRGQVLVTTRRDLGAPVWARLGLAPLRLAVLGRQFSVDLLTTLTGRPEEVDQAHGLAERVVREPMSVVGLAVD